MPHHHQTSPPSFQSAHQPSSTQGQISPPDRPNWVSQTLAMAPVLSTSGATAMLARRHLTSSLQARSTAASICHLYQHHQQLLKSASSQQLRGYATPNGPPPVKFRKSERMEFAWEKDTMLDRLGKYFLMTEMARGMYLLLEQYFRPPYVCSKISQLGSLRLPDHIEDTRKGGVQAGTNKLADTQFTTLSKR